MRTTMSPADTSTAVGETPVVLSIAGSDSGGGAGIQTDLKTFHALGVFGTTAITCVTAQSPAGVRGIAAIDPEMVALQMRAVCEAFPVAAVKTGMLFSREIITAVADVLEQVRIPCLVADPVMVATSGARLPRAEAVEALCARILPRATVITPNIPEAEALCGHPIANLAALRAAAAALSARFGTACALKGGHLESATVVDVLFCGGRLYEWSSERITAVETHGTGCTFAAALAAGLAVGRTLPEAVAAARAFVIRALTHPLQTGRHAPLGV
jgi:hydroxymethylpyrimidine/phosphomethylpyrimidine kinase